MTAVRRPHPGDIALPSHGSVSGRSSGGNDSDDSAFPAQQRKDDPGKSVPENPGAIHSCPRASAGQRPRGSPSHQCRHCIPTRRHQVAVPTRVSVGGSDGNHVLRGRSGRMEPRALMTSASTWRPVESPDGARPGRTASTECRPSGGSFVSKVRSRSNNGVLTPDPLVTEHGILAALEQPEPEPAKRPEHPHHEHRRRDPVRVAQHRVIGKHGKPRQVAGLLPPVHVRRQRPERHSNLLLRPVPALAVAEQVEARLQEGVAQQVRPQPRPPLLEHRALVGGDSESAARMLHEPVHLDQPRRRRSACTWFSLRTLSARHVSTNPHQGQTIAPRIAATLRRVRFSRAVSLGPSPFTTAPSSISAFYTNTAPREFVRLQVHRELLRGTPTRPRSVAKCSGCQRSRRCQSLSFRSYVPTTAKSAPYPAVTARQPMDRRLRASIAPV